MIFFLVMALASALLLSPSLVQAEDGTIPKLLRDCYEGKTVGHKTSKKNCLQKYMDHAFGDLSNFHGLDKNALDWLDSLGRNLHIRQKRSSRYDSNGRYRRKGYGSSRRDWFGRYRLVNGIRRYWPETTSTTTYRPPAPRYGKGGWWTRRQTPSTTPSTTTYRPPNLGLRVRKEIRTLSETERFEFFEAINALKQDTSQKPNKYDVLAVLHQGPAIDSAHKGPNFVGWHRYYLCMMEEALRTKNSHVTLPYWDSTLDFRMDDPKESILWTEMFLGNGIGVVTTGPFALWRTPANNTYLRRQLAGKPSSLVDPVKLRNVFKQRYHRQILPPTAKTLEDDLEEHHNGVHRWVGGLDGHMAGLDTSAMDPVFFLHHSYIDYLWEKFRERQSRLGIDSETDYPAGPEPNQQPWREMDNLYPPFKSIAGYSNMFTHDIYRYADAPTCKNNCGGGFNGFLFCNKQTYKCESVSRSRFETMGGFRTGNINFFTALGQTETTPPPGFLQRQDVTMTTANPPPVMDRKFEVGIVDQRTEV